MPGKKKVFQLDLKGNPIQTFKSVVQASKKTGIPKSGIYACVAGRTKKSGGYKWEYDEPKIVDEPQASKPEVVKSITAKARQRSLERTMFWCQCCGQKTPPKHKHLVCLGCIERLIATKKDGKLPETVFIPVKRVVLAETIEKALEKFGGEDD